METRPFRMPRPGMIVFNEKMGWAATVKKVTEDGFHFYVHNGAWNGISRGQSIFVKETEDEHPDTGSFEQIVKITQDEVKTWYLDGVQGVADLLKGTALSQGALMAQAISEKGLEDEDLTAEMGAFLKDQGLENAFGAWLLKRPDPERSGHDDFDDEPAF